MLLPDNALRTVLLALPATDALACTQLLREQHFSVINAGGMVLTTLINRVRDSEPDFLVVMATPTGLGDGLDLIQQVWAFSKFGTKCIAVLDPIDLASISRAMALDISGYLVSPLQPAELLTCLHCLHQGKRYMAEALTATASGPLMALPDSLTDRERQVLYGPGQPNPADSPASGRGQ